MTKVVKYLRELSIVVIGVAITLMVSTWISSRSESKDLRRSLAAIKFELEENLSMLEEKAAYFSRSVELSTYLSSDKPENLSLNTIYSYKDILSSYFFLTYKKGSMEMFKTGGYMQLVSNKELLSNIWECYAQLEQLKQEYDYYMLQKAKETEEAIYQSTTIPIDVREPKQKRLYIFYVVMQVDLSLKEQFESCAEYIKQTLTKL